MFVEKVRFVQEIYYCYNELISITDIYLLISLIPRELVLIIPFLIIIVSFCSFFGLL